MERPEAEEYAKAWANVLRHYDIQTTQKTLDFGALIIATANVYGTRLFAMNLRKSMEDAAAPAQGNGAMAAPVDPAYFGRPQH